MLDFEKLEKKCKKYRYKKFFYFFIIVVLTMVFSYVLYKFSSNKSNENLVLNSKQTKEIKNKNIKKNIKNKRVKRKIETKAIKKIVKKNIEVKKIKSKKNECYALQFLRSDKKYIYYVNKKKRYLEKIGFNCYIKNSIIDKEKVYLRCDKSNSSKSLKKYIDLAQRKGLDFFIVKEECIKPMIKKVKKSVLNKPLIKKNVKQIYKHNEQQHKKINKDFLKIQPASINELEKLFKKRKTYPLAIKISQKYFEKNDFENSLKWAKTANNINNEDEKSWILYAKSLYNLGDKKSATEILKVFLQYESSQNATKLLEKWTKNDN